MEAQSMTLPSDSASNRSSGLLSRPSNSSLTLPLQELAMLFSQPLSAVKSEPLNHEPSVLISSSTQSPVLVHIEVCQAPCSTLRRGQVREMVKAYLQGHVGLLREMVETEFEEPELKEHVVSITVTDVPSDKYLDPSSTRLMVHVYKLHDDGPTSEELEEEESDVCAATHWMLPSVEFHGLWDSLVYDMDIKQKLLRYVETTLLFSDRGVNSTIISWNRVVLLHGPPGTGKTSLCKALAQKLSVRLSQRYSYGQLVEINSHSLFSRWFSESGKLVQKMFSKIQELIEDPDALIFVLIDEVESLTAARKVSGSEPSDAIRVVNALLTQLDHIRRYPNVILLTTSNMTGAIDLAFVDRADIKQYIGFPSPSAVFKIYESCISELIRVSIISPPQPVSQIHFNQRLKQIACKSEGLSGRTLRKIPFLAHSLHSHSTVLTVDKFLDALDNAVSTQLREREELNKH